MITSAQIDKSLRKSVGSFLRQEGFNVVQARTAWGWHQNCIWVLKIRAVGSYFSSVTGWPSMSINVDVGIYYDFIPGVGKGIEIDRQGRMRPEEYRCHLRLQLERTLQQSQYVSILRSRVERERRDIWWINPDGANLFDVLDDIVKTIENQGLPWLRRFSDLWEAYAEIKNMRDSRYKFSVAIPFAQFLKLDEDVNVFNQKMERLAGQ